MNVVPPARWRWLRAHGAATHSQRMPRWLLDLILLRTVVVPAARRRSHGGNDLRARLQMPVWWYDLILLPLVVLHDFPFYLLLMSDADEGLYGGARSYKWVIVAGGAACLAILPARHRWPGAVFLTQLAWSTAVQVLPEPTCHPLYGLLVALYTLATRRSAAALCGALALCMATFILDARSMALSFAYMRDVNPVTPPQPHTVLGLTVLLTAIVLAVAAAVAVVGHQAAKIGRRERAAVAEGRQTAIAITRRAAVEEARRAERLVIARELHDILSHSVSIMLLQAAGARSVLDTDPRRAAEALTTIQDVGTQSMDELRRLLHLLRSNDERAEAGPQPDFDSVDLLVGQVRAAGLDVTVEIEGEPGQLDPSVGITAYRVVEEALINTRKHAGPAAHATVKIVWEDEFLCLTVEDHHPSRTARTSCDPAAPSTGHGLLGLHERVATVDGELRAEPTRDGFLVLAVLPVARQSHKPAGSVPLIIA